MQQGETVNKVKSRLKKQCNVISNSDVTTHQRNVSDLVILVFDYVTFFRLPGFTCKMIIIQLCHLKSYGQMKLFFGNWKLATCR
jgi:hypothetical protein